MSVVVPAAIALLGVCISAIVSVVISNRRLSLEHRLSIATHAAIKELLNQPDWKMRSFKASKGRLRGFEDDELRRLLVAAGAVAFESDQGDELWGLISRNTRAARGVDIDQMGVLIREIDGDGR